MTSQISKTISLLSTAEIRKVQKDLFVHNRKREIALEISKVRSVKEVALYEITYRQSPQKRKTKAPSPLLHASLKTCFRNGAKKEKSINNFQEGILSKKDPIIRTFLAPRTYVTGDIFSYQQGARKNTYLFPVGVYVFVIDFHESSLTSYTTQIHLLLDIFFLATVNSTLFKVSKTQSLLNRFQFYSERTDDIVRFREILKHSAELMHKVFGFEEIVFEASKKIRNFFYEEKYFLFDYIEQEGDTTKNMHPKTIMKKDYDQGFSIFLLKNREIIIYVKSPNYSDSFLRDVLRIDKFLSNLAMTLEIIYYYAINREKYSRREQFLRYSGERDHLTKLLNRTGLYRLAREKLQKKMLIVLIEIDIDNFKQINDTYGHDAGDEVLKYLSSLMGEHFTRNTLFSRFGGEEFYILIPNKQLPEGLFFLESFRMAVEKGCYYYEDKSSPKAKKTPIQFTISCGLSTFRCPNDLKSIEPFLNKEMKHTDKALYQAKKMGKNCICYYMNRQIFPYLHIMKI